MPGSPLSETTGGRQVVVTGLGLISPVGLTVEESWAAVCAGRSGIRALDVDFDTARFPARIGGQIRGFDVGDYADSKQVRRMDSFVHYAIAAAAQALAQAELPEASRTRAGVAVGSGIGGILGIERTHEAYLEQHNPRKISPFFVPGSIINMAAGMISLLHGLKGPNLAVVTACATGTHNVGLGARLIAHGDADVMVVGGTEHATTPLSMGGFAAARALSTRNDTPATASRPFDRERDGFVLSDGAGVLVLESLEHAEARGAPILAELTGFGMSGDAHHFTQPSADGEGAARCMQAALDDAGLTPDAIDYINAHGTSTPAGDLAESQAIHRVFGSHAGTLPVSSTKSMTGHMLGAAGAAEAIFAILALRDQRLPPTINLEQPGEGCDLDYVPGTARESRVDTAMSNSFGFGGTNGTLIFRRC